MTEIEHKALALVNEVFVEGGGSFVDYYALQDEIITKALCRAIEQHEAYRQEVSDAAVEYNEHGAQSGWLGFDRFIIITKPDPLIEAMREACGAQGLATKHTPGELTEHLRAALAARGLTITETKE